MSNLSELLPAGSSVKSADFVAQGTLASGVTVGLRSDGKVEAITGTSTDIGTKSAAIFSAASAYGTSAYDINSDRYVIAFQNTSTGYPTAVVAQLTGTTFTFGTPVVWQSADASKEQAIYDPDQNKVVIFYQTRLGGVDNSGTGIVGNVTAGTNSITFGTAVSWMTKSNNAWSMAYDTTADRFVGHYYDNGNNNYLYGVVAAVSGTTITFGTPVVVRSVAYHSSGGTVYDAYRNKIIYVYREDSAAQYAGIGTVNAGSNSISYTTAQAVGSDASQIFLTYDPVSYKTVDLYRVNGDLTTTKYRVITNSGSSLTFGAEATAFSESANIILYRPVYDVTNSRIVQPYVDVSDTSPGNYGIVYRTATISGDTVTYSDKTDLGIASDFYGGADGLSCDQSNAKFVLPFRDNTDSTYPKAVAFTAGATNVSSYVGITDQAISSAATGKVVCKGGAITNTGLAPVAPVLGTPVSASSSANGYPWPVFDSSNNKVVLAYNDGGAGNAGKAIVGTVSGNSISYGSAVTFDVGPVAYVSAAFDSNANKTVITYRDTGNNNYGTAVVGTVSGTSISFGTPVVFEAASTDYIATTFDSNLNKIVIAYRDTANSNYGTAIVGTVSGTSISFGTPVVYNSGNSEYIAATFDSNSNKVVVAYNDGTVGNLGKAIVGTVSGTSISFGSEATFNAAQSNYVSIGFDSNSNKVVVFYSYSPTPAVGGMCVVGTVSGTSISFGTAVAVGTSTSSSFTGMSFDPVNNKMILVYRGYFSGTYLGRLAVGTVSGTSITISDVTTFNAANTVYCMGVYDTNANRTVITYQTAVAPTPAVAVVLNLSSALTPNTAYFVQDDGTISTTSSTTKAGTALSTTSLLLTG